METGILYVVFNKTIRDPETNEVLYKVGITKNTVVDRYYGFDLKMPGKIETLFAYRLEDYRKAETAIHNFLYKYRESGEWFKLNKNELEHIQKTCELMGGILLKDEEKEPHPTIIEEENHLPVKHDVNSINPNQPCKIMVFSIYKAINDGRSVYDATRSAWKRINKYLDSSEYKYAVGLVNNTSLGSFKIREWKLVDDGRREFEGEEISQFTGFTWNKQTKATGGWWQYGNPLVVEFDGNGKFRLLLPNKKDRWIDCI